MSKAQTSRSEQHRAVKRNRLSHGLFVALVLGLVFLIAGAVGLVAALVAPWVWPLIGLPVLYFAGALLYAGQAKMRLPGWLTQSIEVSATIWPPIAWLATSEQVRAANGEVVESFSRTLREYELAPPSEELGEELAQLARPLRVRVLATEWTKERAAAGRSPDEIIPSVDALELLHRERRGESTFSLWQAEKEEDGFIRELTSVVRRGERLPKPAFRHLFDDADVEALLAALRDFDVELLADELRALNRLGRRLWRYAEFASNDPEEALGGTAGIAALVKKHGGALPTGRSTLFRLGGTTETLGLMEAIEDCDDPTFGVVHRGIFLAELDADPGALKDRVCAEALHLQGNHGEPDPIRVLQAYLWKKYRRETPKRISCEELDAQWTQWADDAKKKLEGIGAGLFDKDWLGLARRLEEGVWPIRRDPPEEVEPKKAGSEEVLTEAYPVPMANLAPEHDEVRDLDAYLITFDDRVGPIAEIVDELRSQDPGYRFGPYTRNTRLGIVPRGMAFHEFVEKLFSDLDGALHSRYGESEDLKDKLDKLEVTVNRVDLAHCRELWFGRPNLAKALRAPSIDNVLAEIAPSLDAEELPPVEAAFARIAGHHDGG